MQVSVFMAGANLQHSSLRAFFGKLEKKKAMKIKVGKVSTARYNDADILKLYT